jgi:hypothetical protein
VIKGIRFVAALVVLLALGNGTRAEASAILFTDRDAFNLAANPGAPLTITDFSFPDPGTARVVYGGLLPVLYDNAGFVTGCTPLFVPTCTSIAFGDVPVAVEI